jgi:hypothetical protein
LKPSQAIHSVGEANIYAPLLRKHGKEAWKEDQ